MSKKLTAWSPSLPLEPIRRAVEVASSAPLFADKLLRRAAEVTSAGTRWCRKRCCCRRGGGRNTGIQAEHCLRVTSGLTCRCCCIQGGRRDGHRSHSLTGLSKKFGSERSGIQYHESRYHNPSHQSPPYLASFPVDSVSGRLTPS